MQPLISSSGTKSSCRQKRQCSKTAMSVARDRPTFKKPFTAQIDTEVQRPLKETNGRHNKVDRRDSFPNMKKEACVYISNKTENALAENAKSTPVGRLAVNSKFSTSNALKSAGKPPLSTVLDRKYTSRQPTSIGQNLQNVVSTKRAKSQVPKCSDLKCQVSSFWGSSPKTPRQSLNHAKSQMVPNSKLIGSSGLACNSTPSLHEKLACSYGFSSTKLPDKGEAKAILHCISYWNSQIQIAELAEEHHISVGLFQLSLLCGAEPTHKILESIKHYKERHDVVAGILEKVLLDVENETLRQTTDSLAINLKVSGSVPTTVAHGQSEPAYEISSIPCSARGATGLCKSTNLGEGVKDVALIEVQDAVKGFSIGASLAVASNETRDDENQAAADKQNMINQVEHFMCNLYNQDKSNAHLPDIGRCISRYEKPCLNLANEQNLSQTKDSQANGCPTVASSITVSTAYEIQSHLIQDVSNAPTAFVTPVLPKQQCLRNAETSSQQEESPADVHRTPVPVDDETQPPALQDASNSPAVPLALVNSMQLCSSNALQSLTQPSDKDGPAEVQKLASAQKFEHESDDFAGICNESHDLSDNCEESVETMDVNSLMKRVVSCIMSSSADAGSFERNKMDAFFEPQQIHNHTMGEQSSRRCQPLVEIGEEIPAMKFVKDDAAHTEKAAEACQLLDCTLVNNQANIKNYAEPANLSELLSDNMDMNTKDVQTIVPKNYELEKIEIPECQSKVVPAEEITDADCSETLTKQQDFQQMEQNSDNKRECIVYKSGNVASPQAAADVLDMRKTVPFTSEVGDVTQAQLNLARISTPTVPSAQINLLTLSNTKRRGSRRKTQRKCSSEETQKEQTQVPEEREQKPVVEKLEATEAAVQSAHEKETNFAITSATKIEDESKVVSCRNRNQIPVAIAISSRTPSSVAKQGKFHREEKSASYETPKVETFQCYQMSPRTASVKGKGSVLRSAERTYKSRILVEVEHQRENLQLSTSRKTRSSKSEYERVGSVIKAQCRSLRGSDEFQRSVNGVVAKNLEMELSTETICKEKEKERVHTQSIRNLLRDGATIIEGNAHTTGTPESLRRSARLQRISSRLKCAASTVI